MPRKKKEKKVLDLEIYTKSGKLRKRRRKKSKEYFDQNTENAIIEYINSDDQEKRNFLFNTRINYSIHKLAENIIHTFKFYYTDLINYSELQHEVVSFLLGKMHLYDNKKGKAYSYLGTIAKRYLIQYNDKNYKEKKKRGDIEEIMDERLVYEDVGTDPNEKRLYNIIDSYVNHLETKIDWYFLDDKEKDIVLVVIDFFKKRETLEIFNKQIFYLYVKEITGQNSIAITKVIKKLKYIYAKVLNEYDTTGGLKTDKPDIYN